MSESEKLTGGCLCGAVRYEMTGPFRPIIVCHCGQCRKTHGDVAGYTGAKLVNFALTEQRGLKWFQSSDTARRGFCGECGGSLFYEPAGTDRMSVAAGTIDGKTGLKNAGHIFLAEKGDYYDLPTDGLPQHPHGWDE